MKGAEDLAVKDAEGLAQEAFGDDSALTWWSEHGEAPEPGKKFTRASIHFAQHDPGRAEKWTQTYDCAVHEVYQRPTPKKSRQPKPRVPELAHAG